MEFETATDMNSAVSKLNNTEFKGQTVRCTADVRDNPLISNIFIRNAPRSSVVTSRGTFPNRFTNLEQQQDERPRERYRSRSPGRRGYYPPGHPDDYYDPRRRGYSPAREYRRRTPPRDYYDPRDRYAPPPGRGPSRGGPLDDRYGPPRGYPDDPYGPPRRSGQYEDPYLNGYSSRAYGGPPSPRRLSPTRNGYLPEYDRRRW